MFGSSRYEGLVRLTTDEGPTGLVCDDENSWSLDEANIVCMQLFGTTASSTTSSVCITVLSGHHLIVVDSKPSKDYISGWPCDMGRTSCAQ